MSIPYLDKPSDHPSLPMNRRHEEDEDRERLAYNTYRGGFSKNHPPLWQDLEPWVRDAITVAYLQGKLDGGSK